MVKKMDYKQFHYSKFYSYLFTIMTEVDLEMKKIWGYRDLTLKKKYRYLSIILESEKNIKKKMK